MAPFDNIQPARLLIWQMKVFGMWTYKEVRWNRIYHIYGWILHFSFTFLLISAMYINIGLAQNLDQFADALYMSLTETALLIKVFNIMRKSKNVVKILEVFETYAEGLPKSFNEEEIASHEHKSFRRLRNFHMSGTWGVLILSIASTLADDTYRLPFPCWIPFDYQNAENYYYAYTFVALGMLVTAVSNYTLDLLQSYLLFQLSIYYKLLGHRFSTYGHGALTNGLSPNHDLELRNLFKMHIFIRNLTGTCESFLSFPVMVQILLSAFVICFTVFKLQNLSFLEDPSNFTMFIVFAFVMSLQIYLPCNYGNQLTLSAQDLTLSVYKSNWLDESIKNRKLLIVYMEYLKHPTVVKAGSYFAISLGIFTQTMNNAYRLYAVLLNLRQ